MQAKRDSTKPANAVDPTVNLQEQRCAPQVPPRACDEQCPYVAWGSLSFAKTQYAGTVRHSSEAVCRNPRTPRPMNHETQRHAVMSWCAMTGAKHRLEGTEPAKSLVDLTEPDSVDVCPPLPELSPPPSLPPQRRQSLASPPPTHTHSVTHRPGASAGPGQP